MFKNLNLLHIISICLYTITSNASYYTSAKKINNVVHLNNNIIIIIPIRVANVPQSNEFMNLQVKCSNYYFFGIPILDYAHLVHNIL